MRKRELAKTARVDALRKFAKKMGVDPRKSGRT